MTPNDVMPAIALGMLIAGMVASFIIAYRSGPPRKP
jgi:hypothetical protein